MRERLFDLIAAEIPEDTPVDCLPDIDAIADHLLAAGVIVPPCKVGDNLYSIRTSARTGESYVKEVEVAEVMYFSTRGVRPFIIACFDGRKYDNADFGKIVFLTKEEAEKALAERSESNGT